MGVWDEVLGETLDLSDGSSVEVGKALAEKVVLLYFSAEWCPPCKVLTPMLRQMYLETVKPNQMPLEFVFVSSDNDEEDMRSYFREHQPDWFAVPYEKAEKLQKHFKVESLPALIVLRADGSIVTTEGKMQIVQNKEKALEDWMVAAAKQPV